MCCPHGDQSRVQDVCTGDESLNNIGVQCCGIMHQNTHFAQMNSLTHSNSTIEIMEVAETKAAMEKRTLATCWICFALTD